MSQHSFSIANEPGAAFRADVNSALQALASFSSGSSAPSTTYAYQQWNDTTNNVKKFRNAANSAWIEGGSLDETFVVLRSSNTILANKDRGKTFRLTASFTQTVTAAATLGDGWMVRIRGEASGGTTIDPNASETIDGATTILVQSGESFELWCDGSNFYTVGRQRVVVRRKTADESVTSSTTLQDDDHLVFPIGANEEFSITCDIDAGAFVGATTGLKIAINAPSGATLNATANVVDLLDTNRNNRTTTVGGVLITVAAGVFANGDCTVRICAWVLNGSTAGNVTLQWAQQTSSGSALTFRKGSSLTATRIVP